VLTGDFNQGFLGLEGLQDQDYGITGLLNILADNIEVLT